MVSRVSCPAGAPDGAGVVVAAGAGTGAGAVAAGVDVVTGVFLAGGFLPFDAFCGTFFWGFFGAM